MCGNEPCAHERADAIREHGALGAAHLEIARLGADLAALKADYHRDGIQDVVKLVWAHESTKRELVAAKATIAKIAAIVADPHAALVVDRIRAALEPTP